MRLVKPGSLLPLLKNPKSPKCIMPIVRTTSNGQGNSAHDSFINAHRASRPVPILSNVINHVHIKECRRMSAPTAQINVESHEIKIKMKSNHGDPSTISCSKIDVIGTSNVPIEISKIEIVPDQTTDNGDEYKKLINGSLIKEVPDEMWKMKWPPPPPLKSVDIILTVYSNSPITALRIWPIPLDTSQNIREVVVSLDKKVFYRGEIPKDFGKVVAFTIYDENGKEIDRSYLLDQPPYESDKWGLIPFRASTKIEIQVFSAYSTKSTFFGLQQILMFDRDGMYLDIRDFSLISAVDCGETKYLAEELFWDPSEKTKMISKKMLWKAELTKNSKINIAFQEPTLISAIAFVTLKPVADPFDVGAKHVRITADKTILWSGKLKHGESNYGDVRECTTVIFLYDNAPIKQEVLRSLFLLPEQQIVE
ncbi:hypothetical protein TRFO_01026 [Tritrichomonas foetus]|uniref:KATNIP domain-containing protein n=1 Tax=Tritrichomonas foetus TaxID=1144522 RepID=A0A1J4KIT1_9EUKA|nr:hypothetical protein TRFO_01026 [Tritrichomonas foetus]|eukprot:OHT11139.1 hypothetical protein TRFO_01026 [Tritrichomonas foetus]